MAKACCLWQMSSTSTNDQLDDETLNSLVEWIALVGGPTWGSTGDISHGATRFLGGEMRKMGLFVTVTKEVRRVFLMNLHSLKDSSCPRAMRDACCGVCYVKRVLVQLNGRIYAVAVDSLPTPLSPGRSQARPWGALLPYEHDPCFDWY